VNQKNQTSKQFPVTPQNRHESVRVFLLSQPESDQRRRILGGCAFPLQQLSPLTISQTQRTRLPADAVFGCLSINGVADCTFPATSPIAAAKGVKRGAKQRLWDRPFYGSQLRQQGSPTIFAGPARPTISPCSARRKWQTGAVIKRSQHAPVPMFPHFQRGSYAR